MPLYYTADGKYTFALDDPADGNSVVYETRTMRPLWNRLAEEADRVPDPMVLDTDPIPITLPAPTSDGGGVGGGFREHASANIVRPRLTADELAAFLPRGRGRFAFPAPYGGATGIRVTTSSDGDILPIGYSYWSILNNSEGDPRLYLFAGHRDGEVRFFQVIKASGDVNPLGPLLSYRGTGEGWYFSDRQGTLLYVTDGPRLRRIDILNPIDDVVVLDISRSHPDCTLWQCHSSSDDAVHSATILRRTSADGADEKVGVIAEGRGRSHFRAPEGELDECQVSKDGRYLFIKETRRRDRLRDDVRILDLELEVERWLLDEEGAPGHSDVGELFIAGEDDQDDPCALVAFDPPFTRTKRRLLYYRPDWTGGMGHVAVRGDRWLVSNGLGQDLARVNELVLGTTSGSLQARIVCPNLMVDLPANPNEVPYELQVKACLDPLARYAAWSANPFGRIDIFIAEL